MKTNARHRNRAQLRWRSLWNDGADWRSSLERDCAAFAARFGKAVLARRSPCGVARAATLEKMRRAGIGVSEPRLQMDEDGRLRIEITIVDSDYAGVWQLAYFVYDPDGHIDEQARSLARWTGITPRRARELIIKMDTDMETGALAAEPDRFSEALSQRVKADRRRRSALAPDHMSGNSSPARRRRRD